MINHSNTRPYYFYIYMFNKNNKFILDARIYNATWPPCYENNYKKLWFNYTKIENKIKCILLINL